jgi:hypothetical protein
MLLCLPECATLCRPHLIKTLCCCAALPSLSALPPLSGLPFISSLTAEPALGCLTGHSDYVTSLAASATGSTLASGSLRGEVLLWDLTALRRIMTTGAAVGAAAAPLLLACALPDARRRLRTACCGFPLKASSGGLRPQSNCCQSTPACLPACLSASHASPSRPSIHPSARMLPACPPAHLQDQSYGASPAEVPRDSVYALGMNADGTLLASGSTEVRPLRLPCQLYPLRLLLCMLCLLALVGAQLPACCLHRRAANRVAGRAFWLLLLQASVSLVDVRTGQSVMQLKGHTDNIRCAHLWRICGACVLLTLVAAAAWRCAAAQEACTYVHMPACPPACL